MDGGAVNFNSPDGLSYKFRNNGTEKFTVDGSGNGTFAGTLDIGGNTTATKASDTTIESKATTAGAFFKANSGANGYFGLELYQGTTAKWFVGSYTDHASLASSDFAIVSGNKSNGNVRLKIDSSGNSTFAGDIVTSGNIYLNNNKTIFGKNTSGSNYGLLTITSGNVVKLGAYAYTSAATEIGLGDNGKFLIGTAEALSIDNSKNATFAGAVTVEGGTLELGKADTASGLSLIHI